MNYKKISSVVVAILIVTTSMFVIQSCVKDNFELDKLAQIEYNPNLAAPLVYSSLTIEDILLQKDTNGLVAIDPNNFCTLIYKGNLFTLVASDLIQIPAQSSSFSTPTTPNTLAAALALVPPGTVINVPIPPQTIAFNAGTTNTKVDSVIFKQGNINITLQSDFHNVGSILLTIPTAKKNGIPFSAAIPIAYSGTVPVNYTLPTVSLAGYTFDMTKGGTTTNQFDINIDVSLTGSTTAPSNSDKITITQSISNLQFDRIYGDIGQQTLSPNKDTVTLSIFTSALSNGTFTLNDAKVYVDISNSYGVPISGTITQFDGYKPPSAAYAITGYPSPLPITSPTFSQIGQTLINSFTLDNTNSNIVAVINNLPNYLIYKINSLTNPAGGTTHNNFVLDSSKFKVDLKVELPLYGTASGFTLLDTTDFEFGEDVKEIDWALLRTFNSNGFPLDVRMQAYFVDDLYIKIDSVFANQPILQSGSLDSNGKVIAPFQKTEDVIFTKAQLNNLKNAKHIVIRAVANTANSGGTPVKIYSDYKLDVKLGIQVQLNTKL